MKPLLSERQEAFALAVAKGLDPVLAFTKAGYCGGPAKAKRLLNLPRIQDRLAELASSEGTEVFEKELGLEAPLHDPYETIFHAALAEKKYGDALRAQQAREAKSKNGEASDTLAAPIDLKRLSQAQRQALRGHIEAAFALLGIRAEDF